MILFNHERGLYELYDDFGNVLARYQSYMDACEAQDELVGLGGV